MENHVRNRVYERAIESFMSQNAVHWRQDICFMKHLLEEKQVLEQVVEKQKDGLAHAYFMKHEDEYNKLLIGELEKSTKTDLERFVEKIPANAEMSIIEESQGDFISFRIVYKVPKTEGK